MPEWDCEHCTYSVENVDFGMVKEFRKGHLVSEHRDELGEEFSESNYSERCQSCSSHLPDEPEGDPLICPECGHDHANYFAGVSGGGLWDIGN